MNPRFPISWKLAAPVASLAVVPTVLALMHPLQRVELARAVGIAAECPAGYHWEAEPGEAEHGCVRKHPESFRELMLRNDSRLSAVTAPFTTVPDGAYRSALEQKQALYANQPAVPGTAGDWSEYGQGPLIVDDPHYGSVNGEGLRDVSGRIDSFDYDADNNRLFASLGTGGIWMSTDKGAHWTSISNTLPSQIVGSVAWTKAGGDPASGTSGGTLIVAGGDPNMGGDDYAGLGAFWSNDLGQTWHTATGVPDGALGFKVAVDHKNPNVVYLGLSKGLYRSTDAGRSFVNVVLPTGCTDLSDNKCLLANFVTDVIVKEPGGLASPLAPAVAPVADGTVLAAVGYRAGTGKKYADGTPHSPGNGLYRSDTGAPNTFTKLAPVAVQTGSPVGFAVPARVGRVAFGPAIGTAQDHNYVYAMVEDAVLFNCGFMTLDLPDQAEGPVEDNNAACGLVPGTLFNGLYVSPDFGTTWMQLADTNEIANNPATGTALMGLQGLGYQPGVQGYYNLWVHPDPTRADPVLGVPTRLVFGLEEVWTNRVPAPLDGAAQAGPDDFKVVGQYFSGVCAGLNLGLPYCPTSTDPTAALASTTHPDQHAGVFIPDTDGTGGVTLVVGNDGGAYRQHTTSSGDVSQANWGRGSNLGFYTLLPYNVAVAKDGKVWQGWQDNGSGYIDPVDRKQYMTYGGDGFFAAVDPDNSNIAYTEYTYGDIRVTQNGGQSWSGIAPSGSGGPPYQFSTPFFMDPTDAKHLITGGSAVYERTGGPSGSWTSVYTPPALATGVTNSVSAVTLQGTAAYVGYCGVCDILNHTDQGFHTGLATNVGDPAHPPAKGSTSGWHKATIHGLPNRYINGIAIDPVDPKTVYVVLGGYANRGWVGTASHGDSNANLGSGHVFKSTDAGENFTDISGDLPDAHATSIILRGRQIIVGTDIGAFMSSDNVGTSWAPVGSTLPAAPVLGLQLQPGNANHLFAATFGRGVWDYTFADAAPANAAPTASLTPPAATVAIGQAVQFTTAGNDADGDALTFDLAFGDGAHSSSVGSVSHAYSAPGTYTATLTVTDTHGATGSASSTVTVQGTSGSDLAVTLASDIHDADVSSGPATVHFSATVTGGNATPVTYTFVFGDGENSSVKTSNPTATHSYAYAGTYHPYVVVTQDSGATAASSGIDDDVITTTTSVSVSGGLAAHLGYTLPNGNVAPADVAFDTSGSAGAGYSLVFGDGASMTDAGTPPASLTHRYNAPGTYTATLTMNDGNGQSVSQSQTFQIVAVQALTAELELSTSGGVAPLTVQLDGCHSVAGNGQHIVSYTMDFADGSAPETKTVDATHAVDCSAADRSGDPSLFTHVYTKAGTYLPTLTVTDDSATPQTAQAKSLSGVKVVKAPAAAGGGGGAFGFFTLLPLIGAIAARRRRYHA